MNKITWGFSGKEANLEHVVESCGKGWENIITSLVEDLFKLGWDGTLFQVKEKFGALRFYIGQANDAIYNRIAEAENESAKTCIECGKPGKRYYDGWILPLCHEHAKQHGREADDFDCA